ncbi:MAG: cation transporter [Clostridia bacterium]|nr:cation transporter [Clostridia bacterium]
MSNKKSGNRTLLMSVLMSSPGPIIVGLGLIAGKSSTQLADFVRRSSELLGIILAYVIYRITSKNGEIDTGKKARLEKMSNIFVGATMCIGGAIMLVLAFVSKEQEKGNVIPGLIVALLGVVANTLFFIKYTRLNRVEPNAIIEVQARLYKAKSLVDMCVSAALLSVVIAPQSTFSYYLDKTGSVIVAVYLLWCGLRTVYEKIKGTN